MNKYVNLNLILTILIFSFSNSVFSASFDCKKATTDIEKEICKDKFLSLLDETLGKSYQEIIKNDQASDFIKVDQRNWLSQRDKCADSFRSYRSECIRNAYTQRLEFLGFLSSMNKNELQNYQQILPKVSELFKFFPKGTFMRSAETVSFKGKNYFIGLFVHLRPYDDYWSQDDIFDLLFFDETEKVLEKRLVYERGGMMNPIRSLDGVECTNCEELLVRMSVQHIRSHENQYFAFDGKTLKKPGFEICDGAASWGAGRKFSSCKTDFKTRKITRSYGFNKVEGTFIKKSKPELKSSGMTQREIEDYEKLVDLYRYENFNGALELLSSFSKKSQSFLTHEIEIFSYWLNAWEEENKKNK